MLPSVLPKLGTDSAVRRFPGVWSCSAETPETILQFQFDCSQIFKGAKAGDSQCCCLDSCREASWILRCCSSYWREKELEAPRSDQNKGLAPTYFPFP